MDINKNQNNRRVFSTEKGRICPECDEPVDDCICHLQNNAPAGDGTVRVSHETKGRKGKGVTLIKGMPLNHKELKDLGKQLKKRCGTGGTVKEGVIEIQGDQRQLLLEELQKKGWTVKLSGA
ncbi:MAG: translation initiation factor Sui1 [Proteobacteria bacterium]|nr:translation initiation factor Sui1 [Pseudomonadota bacterium]